MEHTTKTVTFNRYVYNKPGETHDEEFVVGDYITTKWRSGGGTSGTITEIIVDEEKNLYQVQVANGWCTHPRHGDTIKVVTPYIQPD